MNKIKINYTVTRDGVEGGEVQYMSNKVIMPKELTAENGVKKSMIGKYQIPIGKYQIPVEVYNDFSLEDIGLETIYVDIPWTTIKQIYKDVVKLFGEQYDKD